MTRWLPMLAVLCVMGEAAAAPSAFVASGLTWSPGSGAPLRVGVGNTGAEDGTPVADLVLLPTTAPGGWEMSLTARAGEMIPYPGGAVRVAAITLPTRNAAPVPGSPDHGGVLLEPAGPVADIRADLFLTPGARLKLANPDPMKQMIVRLRRLTPDEAELDWIAEPLSFGGHEADRQHATLRPGATVAIGGAHLHAAAILPASRGHAALLALVVDHAP